MKRRAVIATAIVFLGLSGVNSASAQDRTAFGHELLAEHHEISIALSAAPPAVSKNAAVWVLRREGFVQAREGSNGFSCLVQRGNTDVDVLAPTCFDAEASETIMHVQLLQGRLWAEGKTASEVDKAVAAAFASGDLRPPTRGSVGYMMSSAQSLGEVGSWHPHMMIYAPYVTAQDIGANLSDPKNPVRVLNPGRPDARIVVIVADWVDPVEVTTSTSQRSGQ